VKVTIDGIEHPCGSFTFETVRPDPVYGDAIAPTDLAVGAEMTMTVDAATYERMAQFTAAPAVTVAIEHSGGEPDPFWEKPPHKEGWRALLRWIWRAATYELRVSAGRTERPWRTVVTFPDMRYREASPG
jgi:hypothetical protein